MKSDISACEMLLELAIWSIRRGVGAHAASVLVEMKSFAYCCQLLFMLKEDVP